jgi:hypothetical protein
VAENTKTAAPKGQKGYVNAYAGWLTGWGSPFDAFEENPDLLWPNSIRTYTQMRRGDSRVSSVFRAVGLPVRRTPWRIEQNGASDEVTEFVAAELGLPILSEDSEDAVKRNTTRLKGRFSWARHLQQALLHLQYGHSVFERSYKLGADRKAHIDRIEPRPAGTIAFWNVGVDGEVESIQQWPAGSFVGIGMVPGATLFPALVGVGEISADRLVLYQHEPDPGIPYGNSLLRPAYKHWILKDRAMRIEIAALGRYGIGVPGFTASEAESEDQERLDEYRDLASDYTGGENSGFAIPAGAVFKIYGPEGTPPDFMHPIDFHDRAIGLAALANFLNLDGKGGSYALANVLSTTFTDSVQTVAEDVRDVAQADIVEGLVTANWGLDEPTPLLVFDEIGSRQDAAAASLALLAGAGLIKPDPELEAAIRQNAGLPAPDPMADDTTPPPTPPTAGVKVAAHTRRAPAARRQTPKTKGDQTLW